MVKLFIHIGTHKTGSTAIQNFLFTNKKILHKYGLVNIEIIPELKALMYSTDFSEELAGFFVSFLQKEVRKKHFFSEKPLGYILSCEGFSGDPWCGYRNSHILAKYLSRISSSFDTRILIYLRRQDEFIESLYTQSIHEGGCLSFQNFLESVGGFNWYTLVKSFESEFKYENIRVGVYSRDNFPTQESLLIDFISCLGVSRTERLCLPKKRESNLGYSRKALEIARICNSELKSENEKKMLRSVLQKSNSKGKEKYNYFSDVERIKYLKQYDESNSWLGEQYINGFNGQLFAVDFSKIRFNDSAPTINDVIKVFSNVMIHDREIIDSYTVTFLILLENKIIRFIKKSAFLTNYMKSIKRKYLIK